MVVLPSGCICGYQPMIERLQEDANRWRRICERLTESDPRFDAFWEYFVAVRDER